MRLYPKICANPNLCLLLATYTFASTLLLASSQETTSDTYLLKHTDHEYSLQTESISPLVPVLIPEEPHDLKQLPTGTALPLSGVALLGVSSLQNFPFLQRFTGVVPSRALAPQIQKIGLYVTGLGILVGYLTNQTLADTSVFASTNSENHGQSLASSTNPLLHSSAENSSQPNPLAFIALAENENHDDPNRPPKRILVHHQRPILYELEHDHFYRLDSPSFYAALRRIYSDPRLLESFPTKWKNYKSVVKDYVTAMYDGDIELYVPEGFAIVHNGDIRLKTQYPSFTMWGKHLPDPKGFLFFQQTLAEHSSNHKHIQPHPLDIPYFANKYNKNPRRILMRDDKPPLYELEIGRFFELGSKVYEDILRKRYRYAYYKAQKKAQDSSLEPLPSWNSIFDQLQEDTARVLNANEARLTPYVPKGYVLVTNSDIRLYRAHRLWDYNAYFFVESQNPYVAGRYFLDEKPRGKKGRSDTGDSHSDIGVPGLW